MILIWDYLPLLKLYASLRSIGNLLRLGQLFSGSQGADFVVSWIYHGPRVTHHGIFHQRHSLKIIVHPILFVSVMTVE